ncbi:MAG: hypothetical protein K1X94_28330, partial [Sandaracinaceae bacterium]|nr:hypothetical protein [Sandaracinaceae bacterium]
LSVAVLTCDAQLHVNFVNRAAARLFGQEPAWFAGRLLGDALGMPTAPLREERSFEWTFTRADGRVRELGVSVQPSGPPESRDLLVVFHDLTETQQAERVARLAAVSTMAAGFAHEVRNPLANVRMFAELLVAELSRDDERRQLVDRLMGQVNRIERLVRTSLQFARPERPRRGRHWPSLIANATLEALSPRTRKMGGELVVEVQAELPKVVCDEGQLVQVLVGLINNALDATSDPTRVALRIVDGAREGERAVLFKVIDDGPGIPDGLRQEIFNPFFTTKASGTGLGLSIAQQVIHENGGRIELSPTDGGGATFVVVVPAETP